MFDSIENFKEELLKRENEKGLSRMIAGYSWKWISKNNKDLYDILIEDTELQWNSTANDWINSTNSVHEVGCIHTTQGYDLNYAGIIFGNEISYDPIADEIIINEDNYFDRNGKQSIKDPSHLKQFILNIYKTIMLRGIRGTYIYVCDPLLRAYFKKNMLCFSPVKENLQTEIEIKPYVNAVPLHDLEASAGEFSDQQIVEENFEWIILPKNISITKDLFACKVIGESMNRIIPNGSICLFKKYSGGSRNGKIVLVESSIIQDKDNGSSYTVKEYQSVISIRENEWSHDSIILKPKSSNPNYEDIILEEQDISSLKVIGIFERVLN